MSDRLVIENLQVSYRGHGQHVQAVAPMSLAVPAGQKLGIVGESGSGKSTLLKAVLGLIRPPGVVRADGIWLDGTDLRSLSRREFRSRCGSEIAMIFQDPVNALNPAFSIRDQFRRSFRLHQPELPRSRYTETMLRALASVGIDGRDKLGRYPFEFSQGQLQRIMIALACSSPRLKVLLADEPTSSLDVTTQAQVLDLLHALQAELGFSLVIVTHNLPVVAELCDRALVMCRGEVVEDTDVIALFEQPAHDYTRHLLASMAALPQSVDGATP
ncbi:MULTISPECIES: ABC transporter ATP-binding protein [unclassified Solwaraspora]|uniref:ABC transporter ATP-binding protein n=1 Tax=unclassified Solwaraspora TaxID=2627926 RepID=UPI00259BCAD4|nr:ABC transporter ATP-binding protein [Solwaraspora sp. WMMA2056]WJK43029.1 ABC transporter ATP-binding protein [Solwaraspora sp. WMMA2056]